ncbi:hypothetical protein NP233_g1568 [Leucocoprinus birnbaumii]|uniref:F-box domain-containing protein n=1 Tax=Leucocoprinus birnbaumii TaxID=56174 RepID=A0AAD5YVP8_9AGAR|nr:hypothetical protein NP233_g1568 [Leucocoprinus birnbaumii]
MSSPLCSSCNAGVLRIECRAPAFSSAKEELEFIEEETDRLDDIIRQSNENRAGLLRRRNVMLSSAGSLPPETLSCIFQHAIRPLDPRTRDALRRGTNPISKEIRAARAPLILGAVCSYWRQIIRSTPQFWQSFAARVTTKNVQKTADFLDFWLDRSDQPAPYIELDFSPIEWLYEADLQPIRDSGIKATASARAMSLNFPHDLEYYRKQWLPFISRFHQLEDLSIGWPAEFEEDLIYDWDREPGTISYETLSNLTCVTFNNLSTKVILPWDNITILRLFNTCINLCLETLWKCPNLVEFRCRGYKDGVLHTDLARENPKVFIHLKTFEWPCYNSHVSCELLKSIRLPAIETLGLDQANDGDLDRRVVKDFLSIVGPKLKTLELSSFTFSQPGLVRIFEALPSAERLYLHDCNTERFHTALNALKSNSEQCLPKLRYIFVEGEGMRQSDDSPFMDTPGLLLRMLQERKAAVDSHFRIDFAEDYQIGWRFNYYDLLDAVVLDGWRLDIYEDQELIECMREIYKREFDPNLDSYPYAESQYDDSNFEEGQCETCNVRLF